MKLKILFLLPSFRKGGEAKNTLNILNSLDTSRFDLTLLICSKGQSDFKEFLNNSVNVIEIGSHTPFWKFYYIVKTIRLVRPDITFTSFIDLNFVVGIYKLFSFRRFISVLRFNTMPSYTISSMLGLPVTKNSKSFSVKSANKIIAQSFEMHDEILEYYPISKGKVDVIQNIINRDQITQLANKYNPYKPYNGTTLVAVGSLWAAKGFEFLIKAMWEIVYKHRQEVRLYIIGENLIKDSGYDKFLKAMIEDLKLEDIILLEGYTPNPYPYMKHADVFVLSSLKEGFPNVVLEALSLKVPCVVTDCVDFQGIINPGSNGYIAKKANVNSLVEGILQAMNMDFDMEEMDDFDYNVWFSSLL